MVLLASHLPFVGLAITQKIENSAENGSMSQTSLVKCRLFSHATVPMTL